MSIVSNSLTRLTHAMPKLPKAFDFSKCGPFGTRIEREAQQACIQCFIVRLSIGPGLS